MDLFWAFYITVILLFVSVLVHVLFRGFVIVYWNIKHENQKLHSWNWIFCNEIRRNLLVEKTYRNPVPIKKFIRMEISWNHFSATKSQFYDSKIMLVDKKLPKIFLLGISNEPLHTEQTAHEMILATTERVFVSNNTSFRSAWL